MLPFPAYLFCLMKSIMFYGFQFFLIFQLYFQKLLHFPFIRKSSSKSNLFNCFTLKSRKASKNYITLHIAEKIKKKKIKQLSQCAKKRENLMVLTKRNFNKEQCLFIDSGHEHFTKKYNDFYNDLPLGFKQLYSSKNKAIDDKCPVVQRKIKEPFFSQKVKILSSTDIRLHDYNDLNGIFSNYCMNEKNRYENENFNEFLYDKFGRKFNFLEIYDLFYRRKCVDRKCGCTKSFLKFSSFPLMKRKSMDTSKNFLSIKLTPVLENIEYI